MLNLRIDREKAEQAVQLIHCSEDWNELERKVLEGNPLNISETELHATGNKFYMQAYLAGCKAAISPREMPKTSIFPGTAVNRESINYNLHGIVHTNSMKQLIRTHFFDMENLVCETSLSHKYHLKKAIPQLRLDECRHLSIMDYSKLMGYAILAGLPSSIKKIFRKQNKKLEIELHNDRRIFSGCGIAEIMMEDAYLPERIEHSLMESYPNAGMIYKTTLLRSLSQAEFIECNVKKYGLTEIHGLYGMLHEPQIAYFLRNPEKANEMKERFLPKKANMAAIGVCSTMPMGILLGAGLNGLASLATVGFPFDARSYAIAAFSACVSYLGASMIDSSHIWRLRNKLHKKP